jgi:methyl-accepting chemotaxis protein
VVAAQYLYTQTLVPVAQLGTVQQGVQWSWVALLDTLVTQDDNGMAVDRTAVTDADAAADKAFAEYTATDMTGREAAVQRFRTSLAQLRGVRDEQLLPLATNNDLPGFEKVRDATGRPALKATVAALDELVTIKTKVAADTHAETAAAYDSARTPDALGRVSKALAAGDLTVRAAVRDELGRMATELDTGIAAVRHSVDRMSHVAVTLSAASEELSAVSNQLQAGATEASQKASIATASTEAVNAGV